MNFVIGTIHFELSKSLFAGGERPDVFSMSFGDLFRSGGERVDRFSGENTTLDDGDFSEYARGGDDGADGQNGDNGQDGLDGSNGTDGQDGADGQNGSSVQTYHPDAVLL